MCIRDSEDTFRAWSLGEEPDNLTLTIQILAIFKMIASGMMVQVLEKHNKLPENKWKLVTTKPYKAGDRLFRLIAELEMVVAIVAKNGRLHGGPGVMEVYHKRRLLNEVPPSLAKALSMDL